MCVCEQYTLCVVGSMVVCVFTEPSQSLKYNRCLGVCVLCMCVCVKVRLQIIRWRDPVRRSVS